MFSRPMDSTTTLELIDCSTKLGLAGLFKKQIKEALDEAASHTDNGQFRQRDSHPYHVALRFRLLRQFGYDVSLGNWSRRA